MIIRNRERAEMLISQIRFNGCTERRLDLDRTIYEACTANSIIPLSTVSKHTATLLAHGTWCASIFDAELQRRRTARCWPRRSERSPREDWPVDGAVRECLGRLLASGGISSASVISRLY